MLISKRLVASYILDWIMIVGLVAIGGGLQFVKGTHRPFSLLDLTISYPLVPESISTSTLALVALLAPAVIILAITLLLLPGNAVSRSLKRSELWRLKLWELHAGLIGLALSVALAFFITQGLKTIFPKPRPHFLALCDPDLQNLAAHVVGGYGQDISGRWTLVDTTICSHTDKSDLSDGFRSFPSGHSSFSWSGLLYLSLFLAAKFAITIPHLSFVHSGSTHASPTRSQGIEMLPMHRNTSDSKTDDLPLVAEPSGSHPPLYRQAAAPPIHGVLLFLIPLGVAAYITSTRYTQFWHFGFDVISGSLIGIASAWFSFRWHHLPLGRGRGWAWGPRAATRAWGVAVGTDGYVGSEQQQNPGTSSAAARPMHLPGCGTVDV